MLIAFPILLFLTSLQALSSRDDRCLAKCASKHMHTCQGCVSLSEVEQAPSNVLYYPFPLRLHNQDCAYKMCSVLRSMNVYVCVYVMCTYMYVYNSSYYWFIILVLAQSIFAYLKVSQWYLVTMTNTSNLNYVNSMQYYFLVPLSHLTKEGLKMTI